MRNYVRLLTLAVFVVSTLAIAQGGPPPAHPGGPPPAGGPPPGGMPAGHPGGPPPGHPGGMPPGGPHAGMPGMNFGGPPPAKLTPEDIKNVFYGIGASVGKGVGDAFGPSKEEWAELLKGFDDAVAKKEAKVKIEEMQPKVRQLEGERREEKHQKAVAENAETLAKLEKEPNTEKLPSGVLIQRISPGTGEQPKPTDTVSVNYKGTTQDGKEFDSSYKRGKPADFPLNRVIKCWTDGVGAMKVGEKAKLICPSDLAYGQMPPPGSGIPPNAILTFEVELLSIKAPPAPPDAGGAVGAAPVGVSKSAEKKGCTAMPGELMPLALALLALRRRNS